MTRTLRLAGLGLGVLTGLAAPLGEARAQERRFFQVTPGPRNQPPQLDTSVGASGGLQQVMVMDRTSIARWLCPNGGTPVRGRPGRCDSRGPARGAGGGASEVAGWHNDLPPPTHRQVACPSGTVAAPARFNPGTVRCMPAAVAEAVADPSRPAATPAAAPAPAPQAQATPAGPTPPGS